MSTSSARPARLIRFRDTTGAMGDGLATRIGHLEDALQHYRATCDFDYRVPTIGTDDVVTDWRRAVEELGRWVGAVGAAFMRAQVLAHHVDPFTAPPNNVHDTDAVWTLSDNLVVSHLDEAYRDDPFLGDPDADFSVADLPEDTDSAAASLAGLAGDLGLPIGGADNALKGFIDVLGKLPRSATITVTVTSTRVLFLADGRVIETMTRAQATARIVAPRGVPGGLSRLSTWTSRVGGALTFGGGFLDQWANDAGLPTTDRLVRATTRGGGMLAGATLLGWGGFQAGAVCGPAAWVCSPVLGFGGGILGAFLGDRAVNVLPWMDPPPDASIGEHDLDSLQDEIAQSDGELSGDFESVDAMTSLLAHDLALAETADIPDVQGQLVLPDPDDLAVDAGLIEPPPPSPTPGTTTTTIPTPPAIPPPTQPPTPVPSPAPTPPTGTPAPAGS